MNVTIDTPCYKADYSNTRLFSWGDQEWAQRTSRPTGQENLDPSTLKELDEMQGLLSQVVYYLSNQQLYQRKLNLVLNVVQNNILHSTTSKMKSKGLTKYPNHRKEFFPAANGLAEQNTSICCQQLNTLPVGLLLNYIYCKSLTISTTSFSSI